ncbi:MAG: prefoldin subunit alpha [Candidatus Hydrothermarchaeota archaeon]
MEITEEEKKELQQLLMELEIYSARIESLKQQNELINTSIAELLTTVQTLDEISELEKDSEILTPIGSGSYIHAKIADTKNVVLGLGADVAMEKSIPDAKESIESRIGELQAVQEEIQKTMADLVEKIEKIRPRATSLAQKLQSEME